LETAASPHPWPFLNSTSFLTLCKKETILITAFFHESLHYIAARLLGVKAKFTLTEVVYHSNSNWQAIFITLAPALAGVVLFLTLTWVGVITNKPFLIIVGLIVAGLWQITCFSDLHYVYFFLKRHRWPDDTERPNLTIDKLINFTGAYRERK
jgi:hypothetical protein